MIKIDVIIPVFGCFEFSRACLDSVLSAENRLLGDVIVIDDASPDIETQEMLSKLEDEGLIRLERNEQNRGYVYSCNRGAELSRDRDFILLNSDTEVNGDWIDRLHRCASSTAKVATVTPFSNNGTVANYPAAGANRSPHNSIITADVDAAFASVGPNRNIEIPTGVGFCMFVRREAWTRFGGFDQEFGEGYGEEVDFCQKASLAGWTSLLAGDVFVYHAGAQSFRGRAAYLREHAESVIAKRYPAFNSNVSDWFERDPARSIRAHVDFWLLRRKSGPTILHVAHDLGGGVQEHLMDLAHLLDREADAVSLILKPWGNQAIQIIGCGAFTGVDVKFEIVDFDGLLEFLKLVCINRMHFHHVSGMPDWVMQLPNELGVPFDYTVHDFSPICPQFHLNEKNGDFCGLPCEDECNECISSRPNPWAEDIASWRSAFQGLFADARRIICPSNFVMEVIRDYFPTANLVLKPHAELDLFLPKRPTVEPRIKIAILGSISPIKGLYFIKELVKASLDYRYAIDFVVIGAVTEPIWPSLPPNVTMTGQYRRSELAHILERERVDGFLFCSRVPETYSYTLTMAMNWSLPIVAICEGAIRERLGNYHSATLLPTAASVEEALEALLCIPRQFVDYSNDLAAGPDFDALTREYIADYLGAYLADSSEKPQPQFSEIADFVLERSRNLLQRVDRSFSASQLLPYALDCGLSEAREQIRRAVPDLESALSRANDESKRLAYETEELKNKIQVVQSAAEADAEHLKHQIELTQEAFHREAEHLKGQIEAVKEAGLREVEHLQSVIEELRSSTLWRMLAPLRWSLHKLKLIWSAATALLSRVNGLLTYGSRYLLSRGPRAFLLAVGRRLTTRFKVSISLRQRISPRSVITPDTEVWGLTISFMESENPEVSVIIPAYGKHELTLACLKSIEKNSPDFSFEVLVVDDAYGDPFANAASLVSGVRVVRNETNLGFLGSCNVGASLARGRFLMLLNNDTQVEGDALSQLRATFDVSNQVGAVGAKLVYPDGRLQEAGGIIWNDASGWNWGRGEDPADPRFNYLRQVDYCSAAALMVSLDVWEKVKGFDTRYAPAYYEDTDLCFSIRATGKSVLYQPRAEVIHYEGASHGVELSAGVKRHQTTNQKRFLEKWSSVLAHHGPNGVKCGLAKDRYANLRILWIEACAVTPDQDSGSLRTFRLLKLLASMGHKVTFLADNLDRSEPAFSRLEAHGVEVTHAPFVSSVDGYIRSNGADIDLFIMSRHYVAVKYLSLARSINSDARVWFDTVDLHYLRLQRQYKLDGKEATHQMAKSAFEEERSMIEQSDLTIVVSQAEKLEVANWAPEARVSVISNVHDVDESVAQRQGRHSVIFVGGYQHPPNIDAVEYFASYIWPRFQSKCPECDGIILGSKMPSYLKSLGEGSGLKMVGYVDDLKPYYSEAVMAVAPLRFGAGVKGKVNEALSYGVPLIGSSLACEGMGLTHRKECMIADTPEGFAEAMVDVFEDDALWKSLSENGKASLSHMFTANAAKSALSSALGDSFSDERVNAGA